MVIEKGKDWGEAGRPAPGVRIASSDRQVSDLFSSGLREVLLVDGDMARTIGATRLQPDCTFRRLPLDVVRVSARNVDDEALVFDVFSHLLIRGRLLTGGALKGGITAVCNAQFMSGLDLVPKSHPNDGRFEILQIDESLSLRQRLQVLNRMRRGSHLPHPGISFRQLSEASALDLSGYLVADGRRMGFHRIDRVSCVPDAIDVWIAIPSSRATSLEG